MSSDRETARIVRQWLEDGATALPDQVLDRVLEELPATPQRRHWWQRRNGFVMNTMRLALAAAVVVIATSLGLGLYFNQGGPIGPSMPTPTPSPTATPTGAPSETPAALSFSAIRDRQLIPPGTYVADSGFPLRITFTVPDGWAKWGGNDETWALYWNFFDPPDGAALMFWLVGDVYADPCRWAQGLAGVGGTVDELAQALAERPNVDATTPVEASLGGYSGKYMELAVPEEVSACDDFEVRYWQSQSGLIVRDNPGGDDRDRIWILDVEGVRLVVDAGHQPGTPPEVLAQLEEMVDSIRIEPVPRDAP